MKKRIVLGVFCTLLIVFGIVSFFTHVKPVTVRQVQDMLVEHKLLYSDTMKDYKINVDKHNRQIIIVENAIGSYKNLSHVPGIITESENRTNPDGSDKYGGETPTEKKFLAVSKELSQKYGRNWTMKVYDDEGEGTISKPNTLSKKYLAWSFKGGKIKYDYYHNFNRKVHRGITEVLVVFQEIVGFLVLMLGLYVVVKYPRQCWAFVRGSWHLTSTVTRGIGRIFNAGPKITENTIYAGKPNIMGGTKNPYHQKKRKSNTIHVYNDVDGTTNIHPDHSGGGYDDNGNWHKYYGDGRWG